MFCSECGSKVQENAKFCYNCGTKLSYTVKTQTQILRSDMQSISNVNKSSKEFEKYIRKNIVNIFYEKKIDASVEQFYKKAIFYDLEEHEVDTLFLAAKKVLKKIDLYITELMNESRDCSLGECQIDELVDYCNSLEIGEDEAEKILDNYMIRNEVGEKRQLFKMMLEEYALSGKKTRDVIEKSIDFKSESIDTVYDNYLDVICSAENILDEYGYSADNVIKLDVSEEVENEIKELGFNNEEFELFCEGYDLYRGISERRKKKNKENTLEGLEEYFGIDVTILGEKVHFATKYFFLDEMIDTHDLIIENFHDDIENLDITRNDAMIEASSICIEYIKKFLEDYKNNMAILNLTENEAAIEIYNKNGEDAIKALGKLEKSYNDVIDQEKSEQEYRQLRKECRNRWEGGGFGLEGAIKGAVTAGALNLASGTMHSIFNGIGNLTSSLISNNEKKNIGKNVWDIVDVIDKNGNELFADFIRVLKAEYPELFFGKYIVDKYREKELWSDFEKASLNDKMDIAVELIKTNPYSGLNLSRIMAEFSKYPDIEKVLEPAIEDIDDYFDSVGKLREELENIGKELINLKQKKEDYSSDEIQYVRDLKKELKQIFEYLEKMNGMSPDYREAISQMDEVFDYFEERIKGEQQIACPKCGKQIMKNVKFCNFCGIEIEK